MEMTMFRIKFIYWIAVIVFLMLVATSSDIYMLNTSDYYRSVFPFLENIPPFTQAIPSSFPFKGEFLPIGSYEYISSYGYFIYLYAKICSIFSNTFSFPVYSSLMKAAYILIITTLFIRIRNKDNLKESTIIYLIAILPLISSSNISFFGSFYQEQLVLLCLPLIILTSDGKNWKMIATLFLASTVLASSKSQFFYVPILLIAYFLIFNRERIVIKTILMILSFLIAISVIFGSETDPATSTVKLNKYHSTYFGIYEYEKLNNIPRPEGVDEECIGHDSWGFLFDLNSGVTETKVGQSCYLKHADESFKSSINEMIKHPSIIFKLPFDEGVRTQFSENYFHVFNAMKLIINNNGFYADLTQAKDALFKNIRFPVLFLVLLISLTFYRHKSSGMYFIAASFGMSQFYISFLGEGYRDMAKHLFGMNFSFDIILFMLITTFLSINNIRKDR